MRLAIGYDDMQSFTIRDLVREFEITARTIRHYEDLGLLSPERRGQTRIYSAADRTRLKLTAWGLEELVSTTLHLELSAHFASVRDLYVDVRPTRWWRLRAGQLKKPFSWQRG